jgi:hypothetical protein
MSPTRNGAVADAVPSALRVDRPTSTGNCVFRSETTRQARRSCGLNPDLTASPKRNARWPLSIGLRPGRPRRSRASVCSFYDAQVPSGPACSGRIALASGATETARPTRANNNALRSRQWLDASHTRQSNYPVRAPRLLCRLQRRSNYHHETRPHCRPFQHD